MLRPLALAMLLIAPAPALAELRFGGEARMGLVYGLGDAGREDAPRLRFSSNIRLRLEAVTVTDSGMEFGLVLELDRDSLHPETPGR